MISAHWETARPAATTVEKPKTIHDFGGFPAELYRLQYPAPGAPALAGRVAELLDAGGMTADLEALRGLDHGAWVPLKAMYPDAEIPVLQMSMPDLDPRHLFEIGRRLAPLRDEGVLIVGSGMSWHNMRGFTPDFTERSITFDAWLEGAVANPPRREAELIHWDAAPYGRDAHPREEHLLPLMVAAGAASGEPGRIAFRDQVMNVVVSAVEFGRAA